MGMGRDLAEKFPQAQEVFETIDEALGFPLSKLMWEGPESELTLTHNAQPAILAHSLAVWAVAQNALAPALAAGHSLGEYTAYAAAGALATSDAARLVRRRGELMFEAGEARPGSMAAVIGLDGDRVASVCAAASSGDEVAVAANLNAPEQTVISGDPRAVRRAGEMLLKAGAKRVMPLKVSGAFHSPLMEPAREGLSTELERVSLGDPAFPVIANSTAEPVRDASVARERLADQLTAPVQWVRSMERATKEAGEGTTFVEIGPGAILSGLVRRIRKGSVAMPLGDAGQVAAFLEERE